ncbi:MAG: cox cluster protein [Haloarculaceae archaeon]
MTDEVEPGLSDQYRKASPWPMFVALGVVLSEVGVVLGFFPVTVGGLLLFGATVAGILRESGYVGRPALAMALIGIVLAGIGLLAVLLQVDPGLLSMEVLLDRTRPFVYRGTAVGAAGTILVGIAVALFLSRASRP